MTSTQTWMMVLGVAAVAALWRGGRGPRPPAAAAFTQTRPPAPEPKAPEAAHPLGAALAKAVDLAVPAPTPGEAVPFEDREVKDVVNAVLGRVNARSGLDLVLVSVDSVHKTVDRDKTLSYAADALVFSKAKAMGAKVTVAADVTARDTLYVRTLRVHGSARDSGGAAPANAPGARYAAFEPAVASFALA